MDRVEQSLARFMGEMSAAMSAGDRVVHVPPAPSLDVQHVWTKRERPPFDAGARWVRWNRTEDGQRWWDPSSGRGFTHTWDSLNIYYRQIVTADPTAN